MRYLILGNKSDLRHTTSNDELVDRHHLDTFARSLHDGDTHRPHYNDQLYNECSVKLNANTDHMLRQLVLQTLVDRLRRG
jgi:GTPase SAR1 family protein